MDRAVSKDGTPIAYDRQGDGPAIILATGALDDGTENAPLATELAVHFTVYNYNRRGRGESGNTQPYALELFMRLAGSPDDQIEEAKNSPYWPGMLTLAHTLAYDAACCRGYLPPTDLLATIDQPALVTTGEGADLFEAAADVIAESLPPPNDESSTARATSSTRRPSLRSWSASSTADPSRSAQPRTAARTHSTSGRCAATCRHDSPSSTLANRDPSRAPK